jgi:hypothetical protein
VIAAALAAITPRIAGDERLSPCCDTVIASEARHAARSGARCVIGHIVR